MNLLTVQLPKTVEISGTAVPINTDYRVWTSFESLALNGEATAERLLSLCYPGSVQDPVEALKKAIWFYRLGKEEDTPGKGGAGKGRCYDFEQDSAPLVASFRAAYGIDLLSEKLHWWAFRALMLDLPENCPFCKIVGYRTVDTRGMSGKQKKFYAEQKKRYALQAKTAECPMTLQERNQSMRDYISSRFLELEESRGKS